MKASLRFLAIVCVLISCAQIRTPQGGMKDEQPPVVISSPNGMTQYTDQEIEILLDEYVEIYDAQSEVLISPPTSKPPKIEARMRKVICSFADTLAPNTTRVINFGNSIRDINEGNILANYTLAYSNGDIIDSLEFGGSVRDALRDSLVPGLRVMLFTSDTGIFSKSELPQYVARTDKDGNFQFRHLKEGAYFLTALDDKNQNFHWDEGEALALHSSFTLLPDTNDIELLISMPDASSALINGFEADSSGSFSFQVDECFDDSLEIRSSNLTLPKYRLSAKIFSWLPTTAGENAPIEIFYKNERVDSFHVKMFAEPTKFQLILTQANTIRSQDTLIISSPRSLSGTGEITIMRAKDSTLVSDIDMRLRNPFEIAIKTRWLPGDAYKVILEGAMDMHHAPADTLRFEIQLNESENTGEISIAESKANSLFWIETKGRKIFPDAIKRDGRITFLELAPGEYILFELLDANGNGKFDPLHVQKGRSTERVFRSKAINVRANWTAEISPPSENK